MYNENCYGYLMIDLDKIDIYDFLTHRPSFLFLDKISLVLFKLLIFKITSDSGGRKLKGEISLLFISEQEKNNTEVIKMSVTFFITYILL